MPPSTCVILLCSLSFLYFSTASNLLPNFTKHSDQAKISHKRWLQYYFFEERLSSPNRPVILWLTGIPGLSSTVALFYENGPFGINDDLTLSWNQYGWDKHANILYLDEPYGTGLSCTSTNSCAYSMKENEIVDDLYVFLKWFFEKAFSKFKGNDFYIIGQSYAGKYAPMLASRIYNDMETKKKEEKSINLKGIALGNAFTRPKTQYGTLLNFSEALVDSNDKEYLQQLSNICEDSASNCETSGNGVCCSNTYKYCDELLQSIVGERVNVYDINKEKVTSLNYDFSRVERFMNDKSVKDALGVGGDIDFSMYNSNVFDLFKKEYMKNAADYVTFLLERGIHVLVYAGENDLMCNHIGNLKWLEELSWTWNTQFKESQPTSFMDETGELIAYKNLLFLKVFKAGHMAGMDQPRVVFHMIERWLKYVQNYIDEN